MYTYYFHMREISHNSLNTLCISLCRFINNTPIEEPCANAFFSSKSLLRNNLLTVFCPFNGKRKESTFDLNNFEFSSRKINFIRLLVHISAILDFAFQKHQYWNSIRKQNVPENLELPWIQYKPTQYRIISSERENNCGMNFLCY